MTSLSIKCYYIWMFFSAPAGCVISTCVIRGISLSNINALCTTVFCSNIWIMMRVNYSENLFINISDFISQHAPLHHLLYMLLGLYGAGTSLYGVILKTTETYIHVSKLSSIWSYVILIRCQLKVIWTFQCLIVGSIEFKMWVKPSFPE